MKSYKFNTKDFDLIRQMLMEGKVNTIGIDWVASLITWSWVYYYKYQTL